MERSYARREPTCTMRCSEAMRTFAALLAALTLVPATAAKEGVVARLEKPTVLRSLAGTKVTLTWTLRAGTRPFTAAGIYVRLNGGREIAAIELQTGRFRARVTIPPGGVRAIV